MTRKDYIRLIHIARGRTYRCSACGRLSYKSEDPQPVCCDCGISMHRISDIEYRQRILSPLTGKQSTKLMDDVELEKVYSLFTRLGFKPKEKSADSVMQEYQDGRKKTIAVILSEAKAVLGPAWQSRLNNFVASKTGGESSLYKLSDIQLRQVVGWIRRYRKYNGTQARVLNIDDN